MNKFTRKIVERFKRSSTIKSENLSRKLRHSNNITVSTNDEEIILKPTRINNSKLYMHIPNNLGFEDFGLIETGYGSKLSTEYSNEVFYDDENADKLPLLETSIAIETDNFKKKITFDKYVEFVKVRDEIESEFDETFKNRVVIRYMGRGSEELRRHTIILLVRENNFKYHRIYINYRSKAEETLDLVTEIVNKIQLNKR